MMLYRKFLQIYIVISKSIIVNYFRWFFMIQLLSRCMSFNGQARAICVLCFKRNGHCDVMGVLIGCCHIKVFLNHQPFRYCMWCEPKSYNRVYVHFCVSCILEAFTNDPCAALTNDCVCCLHWLSICVGICSICRPWFLLGLAGCEALPSHL